MFSSDNIWMILCLSTAPGRDSSAHPEMLNLLKCKINVYPSHLNSSQKGKKKRRGGGGEFPLQKKQHNVTPVPVKRTEIKIKIKNSPMFWVGQILDKI